MAFSIEVENIKCGGCAGTIRKRVMELPGVNDAEVLVEQGVVLIEADESLRSDVVEILLQSGYPETGSAKGMASLKAKATSFVSCAIGRMGEKG
jgi:copper chaperone